MCTMSPICSSMPGLATTSGGGPAAPAPTLESAIAGLAAAVGQLTTVVARMQGSGGAVQPVADAVAGGGSPATAAPVAAASAGAQAVVATPPTAPVAAAVPARDKPIYPVPADHISDEWGATADRTTAHGGLDLASPTGTPIKAALGGTVVEAKSSGSWGNEVLIDHHDGLFTRYAHQSEMLVKPGQDVKQGDVIGKVGSTGQSTGPHLHFEVMEGGTAPANRRDPHVWLDTGRLTADANPSAAH